MSISVIIPAYNEERYLADTLASLQAAERFLRVRSVVPVEVLVVDNGSTDRTTEVAWAHGVLVVEERQRNIARVRNAGAEAAGHDLLVFLDADTLVPEELLFRVARAMADTTCVGGAVDNLYRYDGGLVMRAYLSSWRVVGRLARFGMGACQFSRRDAFEALGGYDETLHVAEDIDFVWRLSQYGRAQGCRVCLVHDIHVRSSGRRFHRWPLWKSLLMTHPLFVALLRRRRSVWSEWYENPPR